MTQHLTNHTTFFHQYFDRLEEEGIGIGWVAEILWLSNFIDFHLVFIADCYGCETSIFIAKLGSACSATPTKTNILLCPLKSKKTKQCRIQLQKFPLLEQ